MKLEEQPHWAPAQMADSTSSELVVLLQLILLFALGYFLTQRCFLPRYATVLLGNRALPAKKLELDEEEEETPGPTSPGEGARRRKANKRRRMRKATAVKDRDCGSSGKDSVEGEEAPPITPDAPGRIDDDRDVELLVGLQVGSAGGRKPTTDTVAEYDASVQEAPERVGDVGVCCVPRDDREQSERGEADAAPAAAAARDKAEAPVTGVTGLRLLDFKDDVGQAVGDSPEAPTVSVTNDVAVGASECAELAEVNTCEPEEGTVNDESVSLRTEREGPIDEKNATPCRDDHLDTAPLTELENVACPAAPGEAGGPGTVPYEFETDDEFERLSETSHNNGLAAKASPCDGNPGSPSLGVADLGLNGMWQMIKGDVVVVEGDLLTFGDGSVHKIAPLPENAFVADIFGETYTAQLDNEGLYLGWSDGDVWTRVISLTHICSPIVEDQYQQQQQQQQQPIDSWMQPIVEDQYQQQQQQQHEEQSQLRPDMTQSHVPCLVTEDDMGLALMMGGVVASPKDNWEACWDWKKKGWCPRGNKCEWEHPPILTPTSVCQPCVGLFL